MQKIEIDINNERDVRLGKIRDLGAVGVQAFPAVSMKVDTVAGALAKGEGAETHTAGRIMVMRDIGKLTFCVLQDESGSIQLVLREEEIGADSYTLFVKKIDAGDIIDVTGERTVTKQGEESISVHEWRLLTKAILPLPDKFHGLQNEELRMRKRYLDLLVHPEHREIFKKRAHFWDVTRSFLKEKGFFEVETPYLETTTGGAEATPFATHHNDFDMDVYLRISVGELWQKRLMAAGFEKTFEIGRVFRNEGSSPDHLQEFTNMEFYWGYADYKKGMILVQELYRRIAKDVFGKTAFTTKGMSYNLADEWPEIDYVTEVETQTGLNVLSATEEEMKAVLKELGVTYEGENKERLTDTLWKFCRKNIAGPAFLMNHPKLVSPLAKTHRDNPELTERFQIIIAGSEIGNGYSELNDPIEQRLRFEAQQQLIAGGDTEAMMPDWEFVEMLEHGMPPTCGFGFGERLFAFLVDKPLREVTLFPLVKPIVQKDTNASKGAKDTKVPKGISNKVFETRDADFQPLPISREEAWSVVQAYNTEQAEFNHYLESEAVMRGLARHLGRDEEYWGMLGLLHDLDWHETKAKNEMMHGKRSVEILEEKGFPEDFRQIIFSHVYGTPCGGGDVGEKQRSRDIEHALAAAETVTGLIHASALMREGKIASLEVTSVKKKFKNKKFAAKVDRDVILECEKLGLMLEEFLKIALDSIKNVADTVELT